MKIRQNLTIYLFFCLCIGLIVFAKLGLWNAIVVDENSKYKEIKHDEVDESFFKNVEYYNVDDSRPLLKLTAQELTISNSTGIVLGFDQDGIIYRYDKNQKIEKSPVLFKSKNSRALLNKQQLFLDKEVEIEIDHTKLSADKISIFNNGELVEASKNVSTVSVVEKTDDQIVVTSDFATYKPELGLFDFKSRVIGKVERKKVYEENLSFKAQNLSLNSKEAKALFKGDVLLSKDNFEASGQNGEVYLENYNKKLKYYALSVDVKLQEKLMMAGKPAVRKAFAEKLEGLMSDKKIILTGYPKVFQGKDVIKGNRIIIRENVETVEVDDANTNITLDKEKGIRE